MAIEGMDQEQDPRGGKEGRSVGFWIQTTLLVKKNWKCKLRAGKTKLAGELFFPAFCLLFISFLVALQPDSTYPSQTIPDSEPTNVLKGLGFHSSMERNISVVPDTPESHEIARIIQEVALNRSVRVPDLNFVFYQTVKELAESHYNETSGTDLAIVFTEISKDAAVFKYTIITDSGEFTSPPSSVQSTVGLGTCRENKGRGPLQYPSSCPVNGYYYSGFLGLQYLADQALMKYSGVTAPGKDIPEVTIQNYPKLPYVDGMSSLLRVIIPIYSVIPMAQLVNSILVMIVTEKEDRIKDGFRMIGVSDGAYWLSWFIVYSTIISFLSVIFVLVMNRAHVLSNINFVILFLVFFLFGLSMITFSFALTPFFHKPKTAGVIGTLIMQICGLLFLLQTDAVLLPLRLISSLAFTTALDEACEYEYHGGIQFGDLLPGRRGARILYSLIFLVFDIIFYAIIAVYLDNVMPTEYGVRKHPLFCFSLFRKSKRTGDSGYTRSTLSEDNLNESCSDDPNVEKVSPSMLGKEAIQIRNVYKTYTSWGSNKAEAVKGISLDIYDGQITAILGKNGAGKSTLFNILTGLVPPTKGLCTVFGMNTSDPVDMDKLRKMTGVCLQIDLLFPYLTLEEHLQLYGKLRGLDENGLEAESTMLLNELKLTEKRKTKADNLSGGEKRKLSVAIALIGDPKIILLDEPSAGVDPVFRRHLWSLLKAKKEGRVILLTTHFLDEADILADRKAIIHDGVLKCHGSSLFLKNKFGVGYHLTVETSGHTEARECDDIIGNWLPQALSSKNIIGKEVKYCLPHSEAHLFSQLFKDLESLIATPESVYKSYGVSMTTLEEVFLKISNDSWEEKNKSGGHENFGCEDPSGINTSVGEQSLLEDVAEINVSFMESLWVLSLIRILRLLRSPQQSLLCMVVMPPILITIGLNAMKSTTQLVDWEVLTGKLSFGNATDIYSNPDQLRLAYNMEDILNPNSSVIGYLQERRFSLNKYSGKYPDLLDPSLSDIGTMAAVTIENEKLTNLRINGTFLHSPPLLQNMLSQFYWKTYTNNASVAASAASFAPSSSDLDVSEFFSVFIIGTPFTMAAVGMVMELVKDREMGIRDHLRVNGVSFAVYFLSIFINFGFFLMLVTVMELGLICIFALPGFMNPYALIVTALILFLFVPSCLLFSAAFSYLFDRMEAAQSVYSPISIWMGTLMGTVMLALDSLNGGSNAVLITHAAFSATDVFYIPFATFYWVNKQYMLCSIRGTCDELSFRDYMGPEIIIMIVCLVVQIPVFSVLVVVADVMKSEGSAMAAIRGVFKRKMDRSSRLINKWNGDEEDAYQLNVGMEEDVRREKARVGNLFNGTDCEDSSVIMVENLMKSYNVGITGRCNKNQEQRHKALKGINFAVEKGEVFGLLGHNGAGKTTTMRIIIAQEGADYGRVRICGSDVESSYSDVFLKLGYCAQHNPLWEDITLKEHLYLYSVIRGIPHGNREKLLNQLLTGLQIQEHGDKKACELSGGTMRKLCFAMSILGSPKIVLLDEPSTGMDPQSKRFLWNTILGLFKESRGAILTTHSMEEAEILCTRIAILAKGSLICIGSPQHLKSKYGTGYTLEIKLKSDELTHNDDDDMSSEQRYAFVREHFPDCTVNEIFSDKAVFSLPVTNVPSISQTFALLEQLKREYNVEEYSLSQTTLEQIFLMFAKENEESDDTTSIADETQLLLQGFANA